MIGELRSRSNPTAESVFVLACPECMEEDEKPAKRPAKEYMLTPPVRAWIECVGCGQKIQLMLTPEVAYAWWQAIQMMRLKFWERVCFDCQEASTCG